MNTGELQPGDHFEKPIEEICTYLSEPIDQPLVVVAPEIWNDTRREVYLAESILEALRSVSMLTVVTSLRTESRCASTENIVSIIECLTVEQ